MVGLLGRLVCETSEDQDTPWSSAVFGTSGRAAERYDLVLKDQPGVARLLALTPRESGAMKCVDEGQHNETGNQVYAPANGGDHRFAFLVMVVRMARHANECHAGE